MKTIFNVDLEPMPLHGNGQWVWNGYEITHTGTDVNGEEYQRKGMWMWVANDSQNAWMANASVEEINEFYKPQTSERIGEVLNKIILTLAAAVGITVITFLIF